MSESLHVRITIQDTQEQRHINFQIDQNITLNELVNYLIDESILKIQKQEIEIIISQKQAALDDVLGNYIHKNRVLVLLRRKNMPPMINQNEQKITLEIKIMDGQTVIVLSVAVFPYQSFENIKQELFELLRNNNLVDNWSEDEQIKIEHNGKGFLSTRDAFVGLGIVNGSKFVITRMFPGGSY